MEVSLLFIMIINYHHKSHQPPGLRSHLLWVLFLTVISQVCLLKNVNYVLILVYMQL